MIDALDEAVEAGRNPLVEMLARNAQRLPNWIRFVITSRTEINVMAPLQGLKPFVFDTGTEANREDIRNYLSDKLASKLKDRPDAPRLVDHIGVKLRKINCSIAPLAQMDAESFEFKQEEIEILVEIEHERWVFERSKDGWVYGEKKDIENKISPSLIPWNQLTEEIKEYDRSPIRKLSVFLAQSGFQIYRLN